MLLFNKQLINKSKKSFSAITLYLNIKKYFLFKINFQNVYEQLYFLLKKCFSI